MFSASEHLLLFGSVGACLFLLDLSGPAIRSEQLLNQKETFTRVFYCFPSSSPRDEVEEKHKSSSYHRHSYHLLQHDSQDASAEQRY